MNNKDQLKKDIIPFAMISKFIFDYCTDANAIKLYLGLYTWADSDGYCFPGFDSIQERLKMSRGTISKSMKILKERGLLRVEKGEKKGNLKPNNIYYLTTNLPKKVHSSKNELREVPSSENRLDPSSNFDNSLVQKLDYNENQLTKINSNEIEKAKPSPQTEHEFGLEVASFMNKIEGFDEVEARKFFDHYSEPDKKGKMLKDKQKTWDTRKRINKWMDNARKWSNNNNLNMKHLSFQEQDRLRTQENLRKIREFKESTKYNLIEG